MNNFAIDKKLLKKLQMIRDEKKPSEEILNSLYAQAILEYVIFHSQKTQLVKEIDKVLEERDEQKFFVLTNHYNNLLDRYRNGKVLSEKGFDLHIQFMD